MPEKDSRVPNASLPCPPIGAKVRWLIRDQIGGEKGLNWLAAKRGVEAPLLLWGVTGRHADPYFGGRRAKSLGRQADAGEG